MIRTKGTKVKVYRNLNNGLLSVMDFHTKKILGHTDEIALQDVEFQINTKARDRVRTEGRKNVHAFIVGNVTALGTYSPYKGREKPEAIPRKRKGGQGPEHRALIKYQPYEYDSFVCAHTGAPIHLAEVVYLDSSGFIYAAL